MKALIYTAPNTLDFRDADEPILRDDEVLVKVHASGICGSDMHAYHGADPIRRPAPIILGHEAAGTTPDGRRVTINPMVTCGTCKFCTSGRDNLCAKRELISMKGREGTFAEYVAAPIANLTEVPDGVSFEHAAMAEPVAVCWHAAKLALAAIGGGSDTAVVIGGGAIGVGSALCLQAMGVERIILTEPNEVRRARLSHIGGFEVAANTDGLPLTDLVIDAVGYKGTRAEASQIVDHGGVIAHIGLGSGEGGLDIRRLTLQEITFIGTYCYTPTDFKEAAEAIYDGRIGALDWIEERPLSDGAAAFKDLDAGKVAAPKIVLRP